jgi:hypothetical protein
MPFLKIIVGVAFLILGWIYLYRLTIVFRINNFLKQSLFNDAAILVEHKKIGLFLILMAIIMLYVGFSNMNNLDITRDHQSVRESVKK